jgi:hypothetical protein
LKNWSLKTSLYAPLLKAHIKLNFTDLTDCKEEMTLHRENEHSNSVLPDRTLFVLKHLGCSIKDMVEAMILLVRRRGADENISVS